MNYCYNILFLSSLVSLVSTIKLFKALEDIRSHLNRKTNQNESKLNNIYKRNVCLNKEKQQLKGKALGALSFSKKKTGDCSIKSRG